MKRILKVTPVLLVALILAVSPLLMASPVSAASEQLYVYGSVVLPELPVSLESYPFSAVCFVDGVYAYLGCSSIPVFKSDNNVYASSDCVCVLYALFDDAWVLKLEYTSTDGELISSLQDSYFLWCSVNIWLETDGELELYIAGSEPVPYSVSSGDAVTGDGIFYQAYDLFSQYIYGVDAADLSSDQTMTLTFLSTLAALFLCSLPFILVIGFIKLFR